MSTTYIFKRDLAEKEKLAPQAQVVLGHIKNAGSAGIERVQLMEHLTQEFKDGALKDSCQTPGKILGFYQGRMAESGLIDVVKVAEKKASKEKAAPKEKAAKTVAETKQPVAAK